MNSDELRQLLRAVAAGDLSAEDALHRMPPWPDSDLGFARLDHDRARRCGFPEVVLCQGKQPEQSARIFERLVARSDRVLATRVDEETSAAIRAKVKDASYEPAGRTVSWSREDFERVGKVVICCAGTADIPVAEEARVTADLMGSVTVSHHDVGVAGLHRLLKVKPDLEEANAVVVVAGMEGALPSVVGGLIDRPIVAVPTSIGYGASFDGLAALLAMLNSCAAGISVVNIDNGFGAGYLAGVINRTVCQPR